MHQFWSCLTSLFLMTLFMIGSSFSVHGGAESWQWRRQPCWRPTVFSVCVFCNVMLLLPLEPSGPMFLSVWMFQSISTNGSWRYKTLEIFSSSLQLPCPDGSNLTTSGDLSDADQQIRSHDVLHSDELIRASPTEKQHDLQATPICVFLYIAKFFFPPMC